jgi:AMIN domain
MHRNSYFASLLSSLLCGALAVPGVAVQAATEVYDVRIGLTPGRSRFVFDLSGPAEYHLQVLENPTRIVVELADSRSAIDVDSIPLSGTPVLRIDKVEESDKGLRYVFEVRDDTQADLFRLQPYQDRGYRLVLDFQEFETAREDTLSPPGASTLTQSGDKSMPHKPAGRSVTTAYPASAASSPAMEDRSGEWSGYFSLDTRLFPDSPEYPDQDDQNFSVAIQPEYYVDWDDGRQQLALRAFYRYDAQDHKRTHGDIRELYWRIEHESIVFKAGLDVVFWGVAESQHLVDIINQTDLVENIDGEEKLGQPMLNLDYLSDFGSWQLYVLPYFRERTYPGKHGRLRTDPVVDTGEAEYESGSKQKHVDFALRWSNNIGDWDIGLAHFSGTSREPLLVFEIVDGKQKLIPLYLQIDQSSLDVQATKGAWLWKLEALYNWNDFEDYFAYVGGFERTSFGVANTAADLGWLVEYHYDERGDEATNGLESDIYLGVRLTANDIAGTMALAGILYDTDSETYFGNIEASRRLGEAWTLGLELRFTTNADEKENLYYIRSDDYLGIELSRYF